MTSPVVHVSAELGFSLTSFLENITHLHNRIKIKRELPLGLTAPHLKAFLLQKCRKLNYTKYLFDVTLRVEMCKKT